MTSSLKETPAFHSTSRVFEELLKKEEKENGKTFRGGGS